MKCGSKQRVDIRLKESESTISFYDQHVVKQKKCVGDPCDSNQHAELRMVSYCAKTGKATKGAHVTLELIPCVPCARALAEIGLSHITLRREPTIEDEDVAFELLAVRVPVTIEVENGSDKGSNASSGTVKRKSRRSKRPKSKASKS